MAGFVQIIEWKSSRIDEVRALTDKYSAERGSDVGPSRVMVLEDRDAPGTYLTIAEFESYDAAMDNSNAPETGELARQMAELCDGPPSFRNTDVFHVEQRR